MQRQWVPTLDDGPECATGRGGTAWGGRWCCDARADRRPPRGDRLPSCARQGRVAVRRPPARPRPLGGTGCGTGGRTSARGRSGSSRRTARMVQHRRYEALYGDHGATCWWCYEPPPGATIATEEPGRGRVAPVTATTSTAPPVSRRRTAGSASASPASPRRRGAPCAVIDRRTGSGAGCSRRRATSNERAQTSWATAVGWAARRCIAPRRGPADRLEVTFFVARPKSVARVARGSSPTVTSCCATADALTGILFVDDGQVTDWIARKRYATAEGRAARGSRCGG